MVGAERYKRNHICMQACLSSRASASHTHTAKISCLRSWCMAVRRYRSVQACVRPTTPHFEKARISVQARRSQPCPDRGLHACRGYGSCKDQTIASTMRSCFRCLTFWPESNPLSELCDEVRGDCTSMTTATRELVRPGESAIASVSDRAFAPILQQLPGEKTLIDSLRNRCNHPVESFFLIFLTATANTKSQPSSEDFSRC